LIVSWFRGLLAKIFSVIAAFAKATPTGATTEEQKPPVPAEEPKTVGDDIDILTVEISASSSQGVTGSKLRNAVVTAKITAAWTDGNKMNVKYEPYEWLQRDGVDAICYFGYVLNSRAILRKYDWWRVGGQPSKSLKNVHEGYDGLVMPPRGTECFTMISSVDGRQRSNIKKVFWR
jgi:hypothetical protein